MKTRIYAYVHDSLMQAHTHDHPAQLTAGRNSNTYKNNPHINLRRANTRPNEKHLYQQPTK